MDAQGGLEKAGFRRGPSCRQLAVLLCAAVWLIALAPRQAAAAEGVEITTVNKRYYLGVIVSEDDKTIVVQDSQGIKTQIQKSDIVERLALKDPNDRRRELENIFDTRFAAVDPGDARDFYELGQWAKMRGMKPQAEQAFRQVLKIDPTHNGAGHELGWNKVDGKYVDPAAAQATRPADIDALLAQYDPDEPDSTETSGGALNRSVAVVKADAKVREQLARIIRTPTQDKAQKLLRQKAIRLMGAARRFDAITPILDVLLTDPDPDTVSAAAKALKAMRYDRMALVLADLAALNRVRFYRRRATYGLAMLGDPAGIDRLLEQAGFEVAGGRNGDQNNPLIDVGSDSLNPITFLQNNIPDGEQADPSDQTPLYPALEAIHELSGKDFKTDLANWQLWWAGAKAHFQFQIPAVNQAQ
ncbi:MAG: HEAT repeat domain-containing protein [Planctomycetota bacterium]